MESKYAENMIVKKMPFWYYYSYTEIINKIFDANDAAYILGKHVSGYGPIWKSIGEDLPAPECLKQQCAAANINNPKNRFMINAINFVNKQAASSKLSAAEQSRLTSIKYYNQIKHHIRLGVVRMKGITPSDIPRFDESTSWVEIVNAVNLSFMKENGILKTLILCVFKKSFN